MSQRVRDMYRGASPSQRVLASIESSDAIETHVATLDALPVPQRASALLECLFAITAYRESEAMPLLVRVLPLIDHVPIPRVALRATALRVISYYAWRELAPPVHVRLCSELREGEPGPDTPMALSAALRALRRLGLDRELGEMIGVAGAIADRSADATRSTLRWMRAGAASALGDPEAAELLASLEKPARLILPEQLARTSALATAYVHMDPAIALEKLRQLESQFANVTDSFGTNSHFAVFVIRFVDTLVDAITTLSITRG